MNKILTALLSTLVTSLAMAQAAAPAAPAAPAVAPAVMPAPTGNVVEAGFQKSVRASNHSRYCRVYRRVA